MTILDPLERYYKPTKTGFVHGVTDVPASEEDEKALSEFWGFIVSPAFSCTGGKATKNRSTYRSGFHGVQGSAEAAKSLAEHLYQFQRERKSEDPALPFLYCVYAAFFEGPEVKNEKEAHDLVWQQLQALHDYDVDQCDYAPEASNEVTSIDFGYSVGGECFMVPSLNPFASRLTRKYHRSVMVFIPREQFLYIQDNGIYQKMQEVIRAQDIEMQGSHNPMLDLFETSSDAVTFSGMAVKTAAECPFHKKVKS